MIAAFKMFYTSVGRKLLMAMTGLFLCIFLVEHLFGNLEIYKMDGGKSFQEYTDLLTGNLFIRIVEYVLFAGFIIHAVDGLFLTLQNKKARPVGYEVNKPSANSTWFSRNMGLTGSVILFFLVVHLRQFFFPHRFSEGQGPMAVDVANAFSVSWYAALYLVSMVILCFHLNHGFQSAFQTMGWNNHKYARPLKLAGTTFALIIMIGFASFPIIFYFDLFGVSSNILNPVH